MLFYNLVSISGAFEKTSGIFTNEWNCDELLVVAWLSLIFWWFALLTTEVAAMELTFNLCFSAFFPIGHPHELLTFEVPQIFKWVLSAAAWWAREVVCFCGIVSVGGRKKLKAMMALVICAWKNKWCEFLHWAFTFLCFFLMGHPRAHWGDVLPNWYGTSLLRWSENYQPVLEVQTRPSYHV